MREELRPPVATSSEICVPWHCAREIIDGDSHARRSEQVKNDNSKILSH